MVRLGIRAVVGRVCARQLSICSYNKSSFKELFGLGGEVLDGSCLLICMKLMLLRAAEVGCLGGSKAAVLGFGFGGGLAEGVPAVDQFDGDVGLAGHEEKRL